MARLQILELPTIYREGGPDETPFALVVDQCEGVSLELVKAIESHWKHIGQEIGARGTLFFMETVDIPANDVPSDTQKTEVSEADFTELATAVRRALGIDMTEVGVQMDIAGWLLTACRELEKSEVAREHLREERTEARQWARHGYEIGQKHCGWTDHGVAPDWLTEGWPAHFDSCEHLKQAAEYDTALSRVLEMANELEDEALAEPAPKEATKP